MPMSDLAAFLPEALSRELVACGDALTEVRLRAERRPQLVCGNVSRFVGEAMPAQQLRRLALMMMEHSYYARESELARGFFTMRDGCRVGVCGSFSETEEGARKLRAIGSLCIRMARAVPGCAEELVGEMTIGDRLRNALILSPPGFGKTTLLRDAARLLSQRGCMVGVADERHEIAACKDGVPTMDVGDSTDVVDGCPKAQAMEHLIRSMAPQVIVTDEIGSREDIEAICEAARMGVALTASAHASSFEQFEAGEMGVLVREGLFPLVFLLGGAPGKIAAMRRYDEGGMICN